MLAPTHRPRDLENDAADAASLSRAAPGDHLTSGKFYEALGMHAAASKSWQRYLEHDKVSQWAEDAALQLAQ